MTNTALKLFCAAALTLGAVSVAHAQFGDLLKGLKDAAKELEKGIQQGTQPQPSPSQQQPQSQDPPISVEKQKEQERLAEEQRRLAEEQKRKDDERRLADQKRQQEEQQKAQQAAMQQQLKELNEKGLKFAKESTTKWRALQNKDQMTGKVTEYARAEVSGPAGNAAVELRCLTPIDALKGPVDNIRVTFLINNLSVPTTTNKGSEWATGRININGQVHNITHDFERGSVNRFHTDFASATTSSQYACRYKNFEIIGWCEGFGKDAKIGEYLHTLMLSIKTFKGEILVQIPPFDPAIRSIVKDCAGRN